MIFRTRKRREPQLIIVSLIDVVLQLVIFLLLTTSFEGREVSFPIDLPGAETGEAEPRGALTVEVGPHGETTVNGENVATERLQMLFLREAESRSGGSVTIRADRETPHGKVVRIVDLARKNELDRLNIAVAPGTDRRTGRNPGPGS